MDGQDESISVIDADGWVEIAVTITGERLGWVKLTDVARHGRGELSVDDLRDIAVAEPPVAGPRQPWPGGKWIIVQGHA